MSSEVVLKEDLNGEAPPEDQPLTLLYIIVGRRGTPFVYFLFKDGTP